MMELTIKSDGEHVDLKVKNFMPKAMSVSLNRIFDELARKNGEKPGGDESSLSGCVSCGVWLKYRGG